jgi:hypothetical protein
METDLIIISEYCEKTNIDTEFLLLLDKEELVNICEIDGIKYIETSQLEKLEMYSRLHYDLSINIEGIDVINNLLLKSIELKKEINSLRNRLSIYESDDVNSIDDIFFNDL